MKMHISGTSQHVRVFRCQHCDDIHLEQTHDGLKWVLSAAMNEKEWDQVIDEVKRLRTNPNEREDKRPN